MYLLKQGRKSPTDSPISRVRCLSPNAQRIQGLGFPQMPLGARLDQHKDVQLPSPAPSEGFFPAYESI